jgi:hypothetical protein
MRVSINTLCISKLMKLLDEQERRDLAIQRIDPATESSPSPRAPR